MNQKKQYVIAELTQSQCSPGEILARLLDTAEKNPDIEIVGISGDQVKPTLVVLRTTPEIIEALKAKFASSIVVEEDKKLVMY